MSISSFVEQFKPSPNIKTFGQKTSDNDLFPYLNYCVQCSTLDPNLLFLELGVFSGNTFNCIRNALPSNIHLYGFDTFTGLPEDWEDHYKKGTFALDYIPSNTKTTTFIQGLIKETLPPFLQQEQKSIGFIHFDLDLYLSTYEALFFCIPYCYPGTILVFDDFYNFYGWEKHCSKALFDYSKRYQLRFKPIATCGWTEGWSSVAIKLL